MADSVWYYARGDVERGPFTLNQIKALANAAKVRPDDLVWREGMETWTVAKQVVELFPPATTVGESAGTTPTEGTNGLPGATAASLTMAAPTAASLYGLDTKWLAALRRSVRLLTVFGILILLGTRGCESLGERLAVRNAALDSLTKQSGSVIPETDIARHRLVLEHQSTAFTRGVALYVGLLILLSGATGLLLLAEQHERWLGVGIIAAIIGGLLASLP